MAILFVMVGFKIWSSSKFCTRRTISESERGWKYQRW